MFKLHPNLREIWKYKRILSAFLHFSHPVAKRWNFWLQRLRELINCGQHTAVLFWLPQGLWGDLSGQDGYYKTNYW